MLVFALLIAGCGGGSGGAATAADEDAGPPQSGGNITMGMDQEPPCVNLFHVCGGMAAAGMMVSPLFEPMIGVNDKGKRYPVVATSIPTTKNGGARVVGGKLIVTIGIHEDAVWSDNKPLTCEDLKFTWKTIMDDRWMIGSRLGWDKVESVECPNRKLAVYTFSEPYAPYLSIVGSTPLPKHDLEGKDFNTYWLARIPVSNGPFVFDHWTKTVEYVVKRNPNYWRRGKEKKPYLDTITYKFIPDTNTLKIQVRTGEVDWITPPPDTNLIDEVKSFPRARFQSVPGGYWEHFAMQNEHWALKDPNVRKAIAHGLNRPQLTDTVLRKQVTPLQATVMPFQTEYYDDFWGEYDYNPAKVKMYLEKAGFKKSGTYYTKGGKVLEITFKSTAGNVLRMKVAQLLQENFRRLGIKMNIAMEVPPVLFAQTLPSGSYDVAEWASGSGVDPDQTGLFACDQIPTKKNQFQGNNNYRYCNEKVTELFKTADRSIDVAERARLIKEAESLMAKDVPLVPLYQRPETVVYTARVHGVINNPLGGQLWNVEDWWVSD